MLPQGVVMHRTGGSYPSKIQPRPIPWSPDGDKNIVFWNSDHPLFFVRSYLCWRSPTCRRAWGEPSEHGLCCRWVSGLRTPDRRYFSGKSKAHTIDLSPHCVLSMNSTLSKSGRLWLLQRDISISDPVAAFRFFPPRPCSWAHTSACFYVGRMDGGFLTGSG